MNLGFDPKSAEELDTMARGGVFYKALSQRNLGVEECEVLPSCIQNPLRISKKNLIKWGKGSNIDPMSIATKTGDNGSTGLMYNRRVPKHHVRVESYGAVDELNAAIGLAKAYADAPFIADNLHSIQKDLITVMGELATLPEDLERYKKDGYPITTSALTARLDLLVKEIESQNVSFQGWATPGATPCSGALDLARTVCRRAERCVSALQTASGPVNREIIIFLNRLSDVLWLMARWIETAKTSKNS